MLAVKRMTITRWGAEINCSRVNSTPSTVNFVVATAREISRSGRSGIYDVRVTSGDEVIAEFRGHSRTIGGAWLPEIEATVK